MTSIPDIHSTDAESSHDQCRVNNSFVTNGRLCLGFERRFVNSCGADNCGADNCGAGSTVLSVCEQQPPLKVIRAFPLTGGAALVHLHNISGGIVGGDQLQVMVDVGSLASVQLTSTGATRIYRSRADAVTAQQINRITVGEDGLLEYLPDALIPFAGSRFRQETIVELHTGAGLFWWEMVAPGRAAHGEIFAYEQLQISFSIRALGRLIAAERINLEPMQRPLSSAARLGHYRYFSSFYICRVGLENTRWLQLEYQLGELAAQLTCAGETLWGVSTLPADGLVVRGLSVRERDLTAGLLAFWQTAKWQLYAQRAVPPRKVN